MERRVSVRLFSLVQLAAWIAFLILDLTGRSGSGVWIKYGSIALCLLASLCWRRAGGDPLVTAALTFTLGADTFLLLLDRWYFLGVLLFCVVQGLYLLRICRDNGGRTWWGLRLGLLLLSAAALVHLGLTTPLNLLSLFYFSNFLCSALQSLALTGRSGRLFSSGLLLFLCCDACVGIFNQPGLFPEALYSFARVGMWLFYLPAQVLITLSALPDSDIARS